MSQPAITQAIAKLESIVNAELFDRQGNGLYLTEPGKVFLNRVKRALDLLQEGARSAIKASKNPNSKGFSNFDQLVTSAQLNSLLAIANAGNFSLAARLISISQPSLHRTARDLERLSGLVLYKKTGTGIELTKAAALLAQQVQLSYYELEKGLEEIENWRGADTGRLVIGTMPLAKTRVLPEAINALLKTKPEIDVTVTDGPYNDLLHGLRHGEMDLLLGALRNPLPIGDVLQQKLFSDSLTIAARAGHPLLNKRDITVSDLAKFAWIVPRKDTPTRTCYDQLFSETNSCKPSHVIEASSLVLIRGLLLDSDRLTIISSHQISHEVEHGQLKCVEYEMDFTSRDIGITTRKNWQPTQTQSMFLELLQEASKNI